MDIFYTNDTLYVNMDDVASNKDVIKLKRRIFKILEEYTIDSLVLNVVTNDNISKETLNSFIEEYNNKYNGRIIMKK